MENRDNIIEEQIKNSNEKIPEALRPENIERKIAAMSPEELNRRAGSVDIPDQTVSSGTYGGGSGLESAGEMSGINSGMGSGKKNHKKPSVAKIVIPIILAACLLLVCGIGIGLGVGRHRIDEIQSDTEADKNDKTNVTVEKIDGENDTAESDKNKDKEKDDSEKSGLFGSKYKNYDLAYDNMLAYKKYLKNQVNYDYVTDDVVEYAEEAEEVGATYSKNEATASATGADDAAPEYTDTNVRTEGVSEADIIKTDGRYIYEYDSYTEHLYFYSVDDGKITKEGSVNVLDDDQTFSEMYIYNDKLILMGNISEDAASNYSYYSYYYPSNNKTTIDIYDISDKGEPKLIDSYTQSGWYDSSRMVDGILYTFSYKNFDTEELKKKKYETYIPEVDGKLIDDEDIIVQKDTCNTTYVVVTALDVDKEEFTDKMAILGGSDTLYVSANNIYLTDRSYNWNDYTYKDETKIVRISYDDGEMEYEANGTFPGYLNDDYSIDEYDGYIRLVTSYTDGSFNRYNGLYIYDMDLSKVSVIKNLAEDETIRSARFMGKTGYFVTFRNTDPLFAVDLSDPENPKITDYLKIPGFSAYLHPYGDGKLLGIGYDTDEWGFTNCLKLSMFDISDPYDIKEEDTKVLYDYQDGSVLGDRNAFMFNDKDGTFGFSAYAYGYSYIEEDWFKETYEDQYDDIIENADLNKEGGYYIVFDYDERKGFTKLMDEELGEDGLYADIYSTRGIVIGDYLYIVNSGMGISSYDTDNYKLVDECY